MKRSLNSITTLLVAFAFSALFVALSIPLGEMFGSIVIIIVLSKLGVQTKVPKHTLVLVQLALGLSVGGLIPPSFFATGFPLVMFAGLVICMALQVSCGYWLLQRFSWSKGDSLLASIPGAMAAVMVLNEAQKAPSAKVIFVHTFRLIFLLLLSGLLVSQQSNTHLLEQPLSFNVLTFALAFMLAGGSGIVLNKLGIPAPYMVTGMLVGIGLNSFVPELNLSISPLIMMVAISALGVVMGLRLCNISAQEFRRFTFASLCVTVLSLSVTFVCAFAFSLWLDKPFIVLSLSWMPGSIEAMTVAALYLGLEPALIMLSHVIRMMILHMVPVVVLAFKPKQHQ
ncbi:AbrB family transcriptional regulator [Vibrio breoganii]|uniref:AbrB family transcriptional regulator n=1 Tax=Vibrio breoganii TaxID=553239 RepID=UPI0012FFFB56|nr:AbrB family transcriptional regulator [Vibrio breoganii]